MGWPEAGAVRHLRHIGLASVVAGLLALAIGCGGGDDDAGDDEGASSGESSTTESTEPSTTTSSLPYSTVPTVEPQGPEEWVEVFQAFEQRLFELRQHPDREGLKEVYDERCSCWDGAVMSMESFQQIIDMGETVGGQPESVLAVEALPEEPSDAEGDVHHFVVKVEIHPTYRVGPDGQVIQELPLPDEPVRCWRRSVAPLGPDGSWRMISDSSLTGCPI